MKSTYFVSEMKNNQMIFGGNHANTFKELNEEIVTVVKPIIEKWANVKLSSNATVYGIRRYLRGAWLGLHVDRLPTHVLSAILQVLYAPETFKM